MAYAIGCLGSDTATSLYHRERAKANARKARKAQVRTPLRNQRREMTLAVVSRANEAHVKILKVRKGHLHHVKAAYFHADKVEYLENMK